MRVWRAAAYIRLSREDGGDVSRSVVNQEKIIREYLARRLAGCAQLAEVFVDDGRSGTDDGRPAFRALLECLARGGADCVICKSLSRMFRNYADQGRYLEEVFPRLGVRFISVSGPHVDTYDDPAAVTGLEVPINGILNDRYAAKTSEDVRRTFETKRRRGEFIGAFAPYGYAKDPADKNRLVPDPGAAEVVRLMGRWALAGEGAAAIARRLNAMGMPNPARYKREQGLRYQGPHTAENGGLWWPKTVREILRSPVYAGDMVQGRERTVSYKIHDRVRQPEEAWCVVRDTHEPLFSRADWARIQALLGRRAQAPAGGGPPALLAGLVRCGGCGRAMRRSSSRGTVYYACRAYREQAACTGHRIQGDALEAAVCAAVRAELELLDGGTLRASPREAQTPSALLAGRRAELARLLRLSDGLYADWKEGTLTREEYGRLKADFAARRAAVEAGIALLERAGEEQAVGPSLPPGPDRGLLAALVEGVRVFEGGRIEVAFRFRDPRRGAPGVGAVAPVAPAGP
ncbi:recombinase [Oscillospiraceae bacterium]|nr:recombinase [Oscillospiraceae bacterium]BDF76028.1 recombinase [Oscillospiraceae bacterium]